FTAKNKEYDGTTDVNGAGFDDDRITGDDLEFSYDVAFEDRNAGMDKKVIYTNIAISEGADAENYTLTTTTGEVSADITEKPLLITGSFTAYDKIYDGTTYAELDENNLTLTGVVSGDIVTLANVMIEFVSDEVGTEIQVDITNADLEGVDASNYSLSFNDSPTTVANIIYSPVIEDTEYDASNGYLDIYGENLNQNEEIDVTKLTVSNGTNSYTFDSGTANVYPSSSTRATIIVEGKVKAYMNWIFNNNGSRSKDNISYNLAAAEDWNGLALDDQTSDVAVFGFSPPSIESAIYNKLTATLDVSASRLVAAPEPVKDIDATTFTITGKDNNTFTLTTDSPDVNVLSETRFIISIGENDKTEIDQLLDVIGTISSTGQTYNLAAADRWNRPVHPDYNISDLTGNIIQAVEVENQPPQALDVEITGIPEIGNTLTGNYTYFDPEEDTEGDSQYSWYRADDGSGTGEVILEGENETSYTVKLEDAGYFIAFEVTPVAEAGASPGDPVKSAWAEVENAPPSVTDVEITGTFEVCKELTVSYNYFDPEDDPEGDTQVTWFRSDDDTGTNEQEIHEGLTYTLALEDEDKYIRAQVIPVATGGTAEGEVVSGSYYGPVENRLPTVQLSGTGEFCQGLTVDLIFELTGKGPWTVVYTDGTNEYEFTATSSPYLLDVTTGGIYEVISVIDAEGCEGTELGNELVMTEIPLVVIDGWFTEDFGNASSEWTSTASSSEGINSWTYGPPEGDIFTSASAGGNIWYTDIANSNIAEQSRVVSPCFDFSEAVRPMIAIDLWEEFGNSNDGAVLQYSTGNSDTWINVGTVGQGINWYNSNQIAGMPGGQQTGWTSGQVGSTGWTDTRHDLDGLAGESFVRFRIAYGSDGSGQSEGGLAFDNIRIGERSKVVLLEHFTNANNDNSIAANQIVYDVAGAKEHDIAFISYHTAFGSSDPLNNQNAADPAARALYYGVSRDPFSIMDGGLSGQGRFNYDPVIFTEKDLLKRALREPSFNLEINQDQDGDELNLEVDITSLTGFDGLDLTLHVAVVETEITASQIGLQGNEVFRNVVRKLLPDAGGTVLPVNWNTNQSENYSFNWTIENVFDAENLGLVAFVQDESTREIYQVATSFDFGVPTSINLPDNVAPEDDVVFYPNPASDYLFIQFSMDLSEDHILEVFNSSGNIVLSDILNRGRSNYEANIRDLPRGIYFFRVRNNNGILSTARVIIMK
ncbi:MAG: YDG domain-containing protein, partial [Bacteroidales bacterium]